MSTMHSLPIAAHEAATVATVLLHAAGKEETSGAETTEQATIWGRSTTGRTNRRSKPIWIFSLQDVDGWQGKDGSCHHSTRTGSDALDIFNVYHQYSVSTILQVVTPISFWKKLSLFPIAVSLCTGRRSNEEYCICQPRLGLWLNTTTHKMILLPYRFCCDSHLAYAFPFVLRILPSAP